MNDLLPGSAPVHSGKVRELYSRDDGHLLMVASDRVSAYDVVLEPGIPDKGRILTELSTWWFDRLDDIAPNHLVSTDVPESVAGRAVVVEPLDMVAVECIVRGYLTGSGLADYDRTGEVCGLPLPTGLVDGSRLPEPIFTPTTKAPLGHHDQPMTYDDVVAAIGGDLAGRIRALTLAVYARGEQVARDCGIIVADTKVEIGLRDDGTLVLADEILTPDSSRFWPADSWEPGHPQASYDKQFVRDWLTSPASGWDRTSAAPPPRLPDDIVQRTRGRYLQAYEALTGRTL